MDEFETFDSEAEALAATLARSADMTAAFEGRLREMQEALGGTVRDLGEVEKGFSGGLKRAFDGVILDGKSLSDALGVVAKAMVDTAYNAAVRPVTNHLGGLLADGVNGLVSNMMPFAQGGVLSGGRVQPFARGGVVTGPVSFPMRGGTGLMGEAGPEAILPLSRGADGRLGVQAPGGQPVQVTVNVQTPDVESFRRSQGQIAAQMGRLLSRGARNR